LTLREALLQTSARFERHRLTSSRLNAEVLLCHLLSVEKAYLYTHDERELTETETEKLEAFVYERISGVPVQYIVGRQEFYGRYFTVNPAVLIPRPETEFIVETTLEFKPAAGTRIIDVGTGSGCIGVTLALEIPDSKVTLTDVSFEALQVARLNATNLGASVSIACMDLLDAATGTFDFVVSNPPYVSRKEESRLQIEVREHEPAVALYGDEDGLASFRKLIPSAEQMLRPGGYFIAEMGYDMEERVLSLFGDAWEKLPTRKDLQGIPRTVRARLRSARS
jgi:release factor glutamine methyltransferase